MDVNAFIDGFALVTEPRNLLYCLIGVLIGMLIGVLPGLGPAATIAILLPITYSIDPVSAIIMLAGIYYGAQYGGTITSVLLRLPGEASSVVTVFDGFAWAPKVREIRQQRRANPGPEMDKAFGKAHAVSFGLNFLMILGTATAFVIVVRQE